MNKNQLTEDPEWWLLAENYHQARRCKETREACQEITLEQARILMNYWQPWRFLNYGKIAPPRPIPGTQLFRRDEVVAWTKAHGPKFRYPKFEQVSLEEYHPNQTHPTHEI